MNAKQFYLNEKECEDLDSVEEFDTPIEVVGLLEKFQKHLKTDEMIEEHQTDIDQLEVWIEWLKDLENDERYTGITDTMQICINVKKELIKEATELK